MSGNTFTILIRKHIPEFDIDVNLKDRQQYAACYVTMADYGRDYIIPIIYFSEVEPT